MYERRRQPLLSRKAFFHRLGRHVIAGLMMIAISLALGVFGYHWTENMPWLDALVNASMILGGMGPVDKLNTAAGKLFASFYALFSGLVFIGIAGIIFAPIIHRLFHRFHLEGKESK